MDKNDLTVILTLRGRHLHTLRWMWHANRVGFPYHVIVADGQVHPTIDRLLSNALTFQQLNFEYHRYRDVTFSDFYTKCVDVIRKVRTRYVMMSDNDDFPVVTGIQRSLAYLDGEAEYVCAGGEIPEFIALPRSGLPRHVVGQVIGPSLSDRYPRHSSVSSSASERVMDQMNHLQVTYYDVYRTEALKTVFEELERHDFSDLYIHEYYLYLRTATLGKIRSDPSAICYVRQLGTTSSSAYSVDWAHHLLRGRLPQDYRAMATAIAGELSRLHGNNPDEFAEYILDFYADKLKRRLSEIMLRYRFPRLYRVRQRLKWFEEIVPIHMWYLRTLGTVRFWRDLKTACGDATLFAAYEEEFRSIKTSLQGDEFWAFVTANATDLL